ncbi:MAG TPA: PorT family protein [Firmicutes bacterium]|nr:PorT family protein [Bacillota bacterium]
MKRLVLLFAVLCVAVGMSMALDYGVRGGVALGNMALDPEFEEWGSSDFDDVIKMGFYGGFFIQYPLSETMGLMGELNYIQKGDRYHQEVDGDNLNYIFYGKVLEMPILFYFLPMEKMTLYAGPVLGYVLKGGFKYKVSVDDPAISWYEGLDMNEYINRFELSAAAGGRYQFAGKYFGEVRYIYGFSNIFKDDTDGMLPDEMEGKTSTLTIGFGVNL